MWGRMAGGGNVSESLRTATSTVLLQSLLDPANQAVWDEFDKRYRLILVGFARHLGLGNEDAGDVAQQTLLEFLAQYRAGRYERGRGRLSSWIISIARFKIADVKRSRFRHRESRGESAIVDMPGDEETSAAWDVVRKKAILSRAMAELRESSRMDETTIRAFELVGVMGVPAEEAAKQCGISVDQVYVAKNRVTKRLREVVEAMTKAYEED